MERIPLDHNATTPVLPEVADAMAQALRTPGNPSSAHRSGREARAMLALARERVAALLDTDPRTLVFTSGGTEADNLAVWGGAAAALEEGAARRVVTSAVEHPAVEAAVTRLEREGWSVHRVPVDGNGRFDPGAVEAAATADTALVALIHVQNEVGTVEPVAEALRAVRRRAPLARLHVDAVQALGKVPVVPQALGADTVAISAHKIHGPKGIGALWCAPGRAPRSRTAGGSQEGGLRTGTENLPGAVGFGAAAVAALRDGPERAARFLAVGTALEEGLLGLPGAVRHGPPVPLRHPGTLNFRIRGLRGDMLLMALDAVGVEVSTGSACASGAPVPSRVLAAMGLNEEEARGAVRVSAGALTTPAEALRAVALFRGLVARLSGRSDDSTGTRLRPNPTP